MTRWALLVLLVAALAAGCSDDGGGSGTATVPATAPLSAYLSPGVTGAERDAVAGRLEAMQVEGRVVSFRYVSAEQGLAELRERLDDPAILDALTTNPVSAVFRIEAVPPEVASVMREIGAMPGIDPELGVTEPVEVPPDLVIPTTP
ncbi:MAG: cell division protein FtsX [Thermoleophilia bacterium]